MKKVMTACALMALSIMVGCSTAMVSNQARYKVTSPDGTVTERFAQNKIKAFGDRAVEQNLKGSLADATEADLSAGIQESAQKSESGAVAEIVGKGLDTIGVLGAAYMGQRAAVAGAAGATNCVGPDCEVTPPSTPPADDEESVAFNEDGFDGVLAENGEGVYGRPECSRCRAHIAAHPEIKVINVNVASNRSVMWKALKDRKFSGQSLQYPVLITADSYVSPTK